MTPPADLPPGAVLARVGDVSGGVMSVRVAGASLIRRDDGLYDFPAGWARALVKVTTTTRMVVYDIEPDPAGRETLTHLVFWVAGAFKVTAELRPSQVAAKVWKAMGRQDAPGGSTHSD